jgi:hypothetical protein
VYSGDNAFGSSTDYGTPPATPLHAISDGTTVAVADFDTAGADGVFTKPVASPGDAYTTADATAPGLLDALTINSARDTTYGTGPSVDSIIKWTAYPPTAASRSTWATLVDGRYVDWFEFTSGDLEVSGAITQGGQTFSGSAEVVVQAAGSLTQGGATLSGAVDVIVQASGALTQGAATLSASAEALVQLSGALTQGAATIAGTIGTPTLSVSGSLTQGGQMLAGTAEALVQASGSLTQGGQVLTGSVSVRVSVSGSLTQGGAVITGSLADPNNQIADIELSAAPLVGIALSATTAFNITLSASPDVS